MDEITLECKKNYKEKWKKWGFTIEFKMGEKIKISLARSSPKNNMNEKRSKRQKK